MSTSLSPNRRFALLRALMLSSAILAAAACSDDDLVAPQPTILEFHTNDGFIGIGGVFQSSDVFPLDGEIWYQVVVINRGSTTITNVTVVDQLEPNLSNLDLIMDGFRGTLENMSLSGFVWRIGSLDPGEIAVIEFRTFAGGIQDGLGNTATLTADGLLVAIVSQENTVITSQ